MPSSEKPQGYLPRIVDDQIARYLRVFGAVEVAGTKWCGKTWAALAHANSVSYVDQNVDLAKADPTMMLLGDAPHVVDEWQLVPGIWDAVRHEVDKSRSVRGKYILTGSSTPGGKDTPAPFHSGAGRIGQVRMHPMSLFESGESTGVVSLSGLFEGKFEKCAVSADTAGLVSAACRGGWPEAIDLPAADAQIIAREYMRQTLGVSMAKLSLDSDLARRLVLSISRNLGQAVTYKTVISDMFGAEEDPSALMSEDKVRIYLTALKSLYLIEEAPGWAPPARSKKRFATKPKRYLADPSLAVAALGMSEAALLADWQTFGLVFENMVMRDLMVYARSLDLLDDAPVRYYRDDSGLEADAIIQLADGRWAALEVKVSQDKVDGAVANLKRLRAKLCENPRACVAPPIFMAVIVGIGEYAYEAEPGIYVIPLRALKN